MIMHAKPHYLICIVNDSDDLIKFARLRGDSIGPDFQDGAGGAEMLPPWTGLCCVCGVYSTRAETLSQPAYIPAHSSHTCNALGRGSGGCVNFGPNLSERSAALME